MIYRAAATRQALGEDEEQPTGKILDLIRRLTDLIFTAAPAVSIAAAVYIASDWDTSERLRKVTIILYLVITVCLSIQTAVLVYREKEALSECLGPGGNPKLVWLNVILVSPGLGLRQPEQTYAVYLHCPILFLLLIRQAYLIATFSSDRQNIESLWYPLFATPEFLAACLFSVRGLVPRPEELSEEDRKRAYWLRLWRAYNV